MIINGKTEIDIHNIVEFQTGDVVQYENVNGLFWVRSLLIKDDEGNMLKLRLYSNAEGVLEKL